MERHHRKRHVPQCRRCLSSTTFKTIAVEISSAYTAQDRIRQVNASAPGRISSYSEKQTTDGKTRPYSSNAQNSFESKSRIIRLSSLRHNPAPGQSPSLLSLAPKSIPCLSTLLPQWSRKAPYLFPKQFLW